MRGFLIAFEGLDQSGKQTQAETLNATLTSAGRSCELLSFPDYQTAIGGEIHRALHGEREYPADVMQLLYVANRYETRKRIDSWLSEGRVILCDRYTASSIAYGEAQGLDPRWLADIQRFLPAADLTILLDIPPEVAAQRKRTDRDRYERDLDLLTRVRASYKSQATDARLGPAARRSPQGRRQRRCAAGGRVETRAAVSVRTSAAPAATSTRAHASSVAPVVLTSSTSTMRRPEIRARRVDDECVADVAKAGVCGQVGLRARVPAAPQRAAHGHPELAGEVERLIEAPPPAPAPVQRHRHDAVGICEHRRPTQLHQPAERRRERSTPVVLERLQDRSQRPVVGAHRASRRDVRPLQPAVGTPFGRHSPGQQRIAAHRAERRRNRPDGLPAVVAHDAEAGSSREDACRPRRGAPGGSRARRRPAAGGP